MLVVAHAGQVGQLGGTAMGLHDFVESVVD
jgi:hypothetical protein